jgi:AcrR family transcriptional regulator
MSTIAPKPIKAHGNAKPKRRPRAGAFGRDDWIRAARKALIKGGIDQVKVERLAKQAGVLRSNFYWHFSSRTDLFDALLADWETTNTGPLLAAIEAASTSNILTLTNLWVEERDFSPGYDAMVRDWARKDAKVARAVQAVDNKRIAALTRLMRCYGHQGTSALVRARIFYFHQVGYYALGIHETRAQRLKLVPYYVKALTGHDL